MCSISFAASIIFHIIIIYCFLIYYLVFNFINLPSNSKPNATLLLSLAHLFLPSSQSNTTNSNSYKFDSHYQSLESAPILFR